MRLFNTVRQPGARCTAGHLVDREVRHSAQSAHLKKEGIWNSVSQTDGLNLLLEEDVGRRRIPSAVATAPGILSFMRAIAEHFRAEILAA